jgi:hypothetical protein
MARSDTMICGIMVIHLTQSKYIGLDPRMWVIHIGYAWILSNVFGLYESCAKMLYMKNHFSTDRSDMPFGCLSFSLEIVIRVVVWNCLNKLIAFLGWFFFWRAFLGWLSRGVRERRAVISFCSFVSLCVQGRKKGSSEAKVTYVWLTNWKETVWWIALINCS